MKAIGGKFMKLKKSYKGFVLWMIVFCLICEGIIFLPIKDKNILCRLVLIFCVIATTFLTYMIYKTEYVYWYSGVNYEDAVNVSSERRKIYAKKHFNRFMFFTALYIIYSIISQLLGIYFWIDIIVCTVSFVIVAISTTNIKL